MGIKKFLTESYRSPVFAVILTLILPIIYSIISNKDWIAIFYSIPNEIWILFIFLIIIWTITIAIRRKMSYHSFPFAFAPTYGWINIGEWIYEDVIWKIRTPNPGPFPSEKRPTVDVEYNPRCPECKTKLEQSDVFYWYTWSCVNCNYKKRTWNTFSKVEDRVKKVVERDLEVAEEEYNGNN